MLENFSVFFFSCELTYFSLFHLNVSLTFSQTEMRCCHSDIFLSEVFIIHMHSCKNPIRNVDKCVYDQEVKFIIYFVQFNPLPQLRKPDMTYMTFRKSSYCRQTTIRRLFYMVNVSLFNLLVISDSYK